MKSNARILTVALAKCAFLSLFLIVASPAQDSTFHGAPPSAKQQKNPFEGQHPPSGKADYLSRCASCHGQNGEGTGNIPALATGKAQGASDGELFWYITKGDVNNGMPPWASLPEEQRWQIINYLRVLGSMKPGSPRVELSADEAVATASNAPPANPQPVIVPPAPTSGTTRSVVDIEVEVRVFVLVGPLQHRILEGIAQPQRSVAVHVVVHPLVHG